MRARVSADSPRALLTGSTRSAAMMLMEKGTITSTKEKSPNSVAARLRTNSREARKCAPEVATGPAVENAYRQAAARIPGIRGGAVSAGERGCPMGPASGRATGGRQHGRRGYLGGHIVGAGQKQKGRQRIGDDIAPEQAPG